MNKDIIINQFNSFLNKILQHNSELIFQNVWEQFSLLHGYGAYECNQYQIEEYFYDIFDLKYIMTYLSLDFEEIIIHSPSNIQIFSNGRDASIPSLNISRESYILSLNILCIKQKINWNVLNPFVSFGVTLLNTKLRISLTHQDLSPQNCPKIFIRKIATNPFKLEDFINTRNSNLLNKMVQDKANIIVAGPTGSGKTSLMKSLLNKTDTNDHLIIMEDTEEINLPRHQHTTHLLSKNSENYQLEDYCGYALRMRPDRLILGELRSKEIVPFFLTMNNGHKGLISSVHSNSPQNTVDRLALLFKLYSLQEIDYKTVVGMICQNIDYIVYVENKQVTNISKVLGHENGTPFLDCVFSVEQPISLLA